MGIDTNLYMKQCSNDAVYWLLQRVSGLFWYNDKDVSISQLFLEWMIYFSVPISFWVIIYIVISKWLRVALTVKIILLSALLLFITSVAWKVCGGVIPDMPTFSFERKKFR